MVHEHNKWFDWFHQDEHSDVKLIRSIEQIGVFYDRLNCINFSKVIFQLFFGLLPSLHYEIVSFSIFLFENKLSSLFIIF